MIRVLALAAAVVVARAGAASSVGPDPNQQAQADGCARKTSELVTQQVPTWVYVNDRDFPASGPAPSPQWVKGVLAPTRGTRWYAVHPAAVDDPPTHDSFDVVQNILPDTAFAGLLAGDEAAGTGNFEGAREGTGRLHTELEQQAFPAFAWPEQGNRVEVLGSWVWDCGHWTPGGERTEFHPFRALWVDRGVSPRSPYGETEGDLLLTTAKTQAGKQADCAHKAKGSSLAFRACLAVEPNWQSVDGSYRFTLRAPPRPSAGARLRVRVVDAGSTAGGPRVAVRAGAGSATVSVTVAGTPGQRLVVAKRVYVGWSPMPAAALPLHLRLTSERLLVRRAMDPGCPNGVPGCPSVETTKGGQITASPGEWSLYTDVAGIWSPWRPGVLLARDGQTVKLSRVVDFYVRHGKRWRLFVFARECDFGSLSASDPRRPPAPCPKSRELGDLSGDDTPGSVLDEYRSPAGSLGRHSSNSKLVPSTCPTSNRAGCYRLTYSVRLVDDAAARARTQLGTIVSGTRARERRDDADDADQAGHEGRQGSDHQAGGRGRGRNPAAG